MCVCYIYTDGIKISKNYPHVNTSKELKSERNNNLYSLMIQQTANNFSTMHLGRYRQKVVSIISDTAREDSKMSLNIAPKSLKVHQIKNFLNIPPLYIYFIYIGKNVYLSTEKKKKTKVVSPL